MGINPSGGIDRCERWEAAILGERGGGVCGSVGRGLCGVFTEGLWGCIDISSGEREGAGIGTGLGMDRWDVDDLTLRTGGGIPEWVEATSAMVPMVLVLPLVGGRSELYVQFSEHRTRGEKDNADLGLDGCVCP